MAAPVLSFTVAVPTPYTTGTITDNSSYVSPARSGYGVFILAQKMDYLGDATILTTTGNLSDPGTNVSWTFPYSGDGWYQFIYVAAPNYSGGTSYAKYAIVYDIASSSLYQSQSDGNIGNAISNSTFWRVIALSSVYASSLSNLVTAATVYAYNRVLPYLTSQAFRNQASSKALEGVTDAYRKIDVQGYEMLGLFVSAMAADETAQLFNEGEKVARRSQILISEL